jgi:choline dehydrogenase-like flavoprotein
MVKAQAVSYIDKTTRKEMRVHAKAFVVAASACETARLLLNSRSTLSPMGWRIPPEWLAAI